MAMEAVFAIPVFFFCLFRTWDAQEKAAAITEEWKEMEEKLEEALLHPSVDDLEINDLKRQKLMIKDEIAKLKAEAAA